MHWFHILNFYHTSSGLTNEPVADALPTGRLETEVDTLSSNQKEPEIKANGNQTQILAVTSIVKSHFAIFCTLIYFTAS